MRGKVLILIVPNRRDGNPGRRGVRGVCRFKRRQRQRVSPHGGRGALARPSVRTDAPACPQVRPPLAYRLPLTAAPPCCALHPHVYPKQCTLSLNFSMDRMQCFVYFVSRAFRLSLVDLLLYRKYSTAGFLKQRKMSFSFVINYLNLKQQIP